jgi:hypothetical protein
MLYPHSDLQPASPYLLPELLGLRLRFVDRRLRLRGMLQRSMLRNPVWIQRLLRSLPSVQWRLRLRSILRWLWRLRRLWRRQLRWRMWQHAGHAGLHGLLKLWRRHDSRHSCRTHPGSCRSSAGGQSWQPDDDVQPRPLRWNAGRSGRRRDGLAGGDSRQVLVPLRLEIENSTGGSSASVFLRVGRPSSSGAPRGYAAAQGANSILAFVPARPAGTEKWPRRSE